MLPDPLPLESEPLKLSELVWVKLAPSLMMPSDSSGAFVVFVFSSLGLPLSVLFSKEPVTSEVLLVGSFSELSWFGFILLSFELVSFRLSLPALPICDVEPFIFE